MRIAGDASTRPLKPAIIRFKPSPYGKPALELKIKTLCSRKWIPDRGILDLSSATKSSRNWFINFNIVSFCKLFCDILKTYYFSIFELVIDDCQITDIRILATYLEKIKLPSLRHISCRQSNPVCGLQLLRPLCLQSLCISDVGVGTSVWLKSVIPTLLFINGDAVRNDDPNDIIENMKCLSLTEEGG